MSYEVDPPLQTLRERLADYLYNELIPHEQSSGYGFEDRFSKDQVRRVWQRSRELGLYGLQLPPDLGGAGLSVSGMCVLKDDAAASGAILFPHVLGDWGGP